MGQYRHTSDVLFQNREVEVVIDLAQGRSDNRDI
jgi:hypothetical protein